MSVNELDQRIIREISESFPVCERPFAEIADKLGVPEQEVLESVARMKEDKRLRRVGIALFHTKVGYSDNIMVVWDIADESADEMGSILAGHDGVSHCYRRVRTETWRYNMYTMVHARSKAEASRIVEELKAQVTYRDCLMLYTLKELKKTGMKYFA